MINESIFNELHQGRNLLQIGDKNIFVYKISKQEKQGIELKKIIKNFANPRDAFNYLQCKNIYVEFVDVEYIYDC